MYNRSMDQLQQFAAFIEFLSNPAEHKKLLVDLQKATAEYQTSVEELRKTKDFQTWKNEHMAKLTAKEATLAETLASIEATAARNQKFLDDESAKLAERQAKLAAAEAVNRDLAAQLESVKKERAQLELDKQAFYARQEDFNKKVDAFDKKAAAVAALMGK